MKISLLIGIGLYCVANLSAGFFDILNVHRLPIAIDLILIISGILFLLTFVLILKEKKNWFLMILVSLLIASVIAIYNERVFGLGDPTHHIFRGIYTLIIFGIAYFLNKSKDKSS